MKLLIDFILIGGIVINGLILLILLKSKKKELPKKLLIFFFGIIFLYMIHAYAEVHRIRFLYILTFIFNDTIEIFVGPLLYVYIKSLFEDQKTLFRKNWLHFVPLVLYISIISIPFIISILNKEFIFNYLKVINESSMEFFTIFVVYLIAYALFSLRLFYKYSKAMEANFSTISETDFGWVRQMLIGIIIVAFLDLLGSFYEIYVGEEAVDTSFITLILVVILIGYLGYYGIRQSKILVPDFLIQEPIQPLETTEKRKIVSSAEEEMFQELQTRLEKIFISNKPYLDEELTLNKLAQMISTTDKKLSGLLNQHMNITFYDLVNKYRVAAVKEKLASKDFENYTLLGIAYDCGFKSKTSFNRIFKKETGLSPSQYKKANLG
ncbi:AraC family transcriptional regulator [uncultured Kordia sp.]|uniref:helix-turn-helix domain-containing protein n=1 Tax=uncultured Kordia sp. TaxID=507699 RepID=UPI00261C30DA|nr:helix-turn-helix domain-containing protein [uncultured Kordia sp.]